MFKSVLFSDGHFYLLIFTYLKLINTCTVVSIQRKNVSLSFNCNMCATLHAYTFQIKRFISGMVQLPQSAGQMGLHIFSHVM